MSKMSFEERYNRYASTINCIICHGENNKTYLLYDRQERKLLHDIHRIDVSGSAHMIFLCESHYHDFKKHFQTNVVQDES